MDAKQIQTLEALTDIAQSAKQLTENSNIINPKMIRTFTRKEATDYLKCDHRTLARYAKELGINPEIYKDEGIDFILTIDDIYRIRDVLPASTILKTQYKTFARHPKQSCQRIVIQNQKGGVGKTLSTVTIGTCLAAEFHQKYRICLVDMDGQSTLTMYQPPVNNADAQVRRVTIGDLMVTDPASADFSHKVKQAVADTTIPNLKLLPADQHDRQLEAEFHKGLFDGNITEPYNRLSAILAVIENDFDIIIIDTPPSFGFAALNAYQAATAVIFPLAANQNDVDATCQYLAYLPSVYKTLLANGHGGFDFIRMLVTNYEETHSSLEMINDLNRHFSNHLYDTTFKKSEAVRKCALAKNSVFDLSASTFSGTKKTLQAAQINAKAVTDSVHRDILAVWKQQLES